MNTYQVVPCGVGFEVVAAPSGNSPGTVIIAFVTEAGANEWLRTCLRVPVAPKAAPSVAFLAA